MDSASVTNDVIVSSGSLIDGTWVASGGATIFTFTPDEAFGAEAGVTILIPTSVEDLVGNALASATTVNFTIEATSADDPVDDVMVGNNPARNGSDVTFSSVSADLTLTVYTVSGDFVTEVEVLEGAETTPWDLTNADGEEVASGVYILQIMSEESKKAKIVPIVIVK